MNSFPLFDITLDMELKPSHIAVIVVKLIKGFIKREDNDFKKSSLVFGEDMDVSEIFHERSLR